MFFICFRTEINISLLLPQVTKRGKSPVKEKKHQRTFQKSHWCKPSRVCLYRCLHKNILLLMPLTQNVLNEQRRDRHFIVKKNKEKEKRAARAELI